MTGVALFSGLWAFLILQQADRHRRAKQQLISMEKALGFYRDDWHSNGESLYPQQWQSDWLGDRSVSIYLTVLSSLTALVIFAMLVGI